MLFLNNWVVLFSLALVKFTASMSSYCYCPPLASFTSRLIGNCFYYFDYMFIYAA